MGQVTIFDQYIQELSSLMNRQQQLFFEGSYKTLEDYKESCGYLRGLRHSYDLLVRIEKEIRGKDYQIE